MPRNSIPTVLSPTMRARPDSHQLAGEWTVAGPGRVALQPCVPCGSTRRAVLLVREVSGSLCLDCRHDRVGVHWDSSYDRFIDSV